MNISSMKKLLVVPLLAALSLSCTSETTSIQLLGAIAFPFGPDEVDDCSPDGEVQQLGGSLDVAPLGAGGYSIAFNFRSSLGESGEGTVGGNPVGNPGNNDFILQEVRLSYSSEPALNIPAERLPLYGVFPAGSDDDSFIGVNLVGPAALAALRSQALPANGLTLLVTLQLAGKLGSGADIESNEATFPITVFNSGLTACPAGLVPVPSGPCNAAGGQDGAPICGVPPEA
jgi:hypothetical protein